MRVLLLHDYARLAGGAEIETEHLRRGLASRGVEVRLFASRARIAGEPIEAEHTCVGTAGRLRTVLQAANPLAPVALRRALADFRPDVVHARIFLTQIGPLVLPLLRSVPAVHHVIWYRPICPLGTKLLPDGTNCREPWGRACHRNGCLPLRDWVPLIAQLALYDRWRSAFDLFVANSEAVRARLIAEGIAPVEVIWNGIVERAPRPALRDPPTLAYAGRLVKEKGVDLLVRALARVRERAPDVELLVAGDGPERPGLERLARELGVGGAIRFLGRVPRAEVERRFDSAWAQVVPGRWEEPFGLSAGEAMMRGTAVVASAIGGPAEIVRDGDTGLLVPPGEVEALAAALERLVSNRELAESMGARAHTFARARLGAGRFVDDWIGVYERLAARSAAERR